MSFVLDERLQADSVVVTRLPLCQVLLMNEARFAWLILVPMREGLTEIIDLGEDDRSLLIDEIAVASQVMKKLFKPYKFNVAALGNMVRQLHVHVIARQQDDAAWPNPIWGVGEPVAYREDEIEELRAKLADAFVTI